MNTRGGNMNTRGGNMNTRGGANANVPPAPPERNPIIYRFLNTSIITYLIVIQISIGS